MSNIVQASFDYSIVSDEQASQLQTIYNRVLLRHMATAYEDGKDLLEARDIKGLPYKNFIAWAYTMFGWSEGSINNKMNTALYWGPITPAAGVIEDQAMFLLSTKKVPESARQEVKQRLDSGENINEEAAKQIRDAHKAKEQAEEAQRKAEEKARSTQLLLLDEQSQSREAIASLNQSIALLKKEMEDLSKPDEVIREVDKPETKARLEKLEAEKERLIQQRDNFKKLADELSADLDANEAKREEEARILRVRQEWKRSTDTMYKGINQFLGKLPMPLDAQLFESDEWAMLEQVAAAFQRALTTCQQLRESQTTLFVEAG